MNRIEKIRAKINKRKIKRFKKNSKRLKEALNSITLSKYEKNTLKELVKDELMINALLPIFEKIKNQNDYLFERCEELQERCNKLKYLEYLDENGIDKDSMDFDDFVPF